MGWYFRKSLNFGPLRLNASKSGLGMSVGVRGARVGVGPRGNYVTLGRGGLYYRQTFPQRPAIRHSARGYGGRPNTQPNGVAVPQSGVGYLQNIAGGDVTTMMDATSADLLAELHRVQRRVARVPVAAIMALLTVFAVGDVSSIILRGVILITMASVMYAAWRSDHRHGRTRLTYDLDPFAVQEFDTLRRTLGELSACQLVRHTSASAAVYDRKRNSGASQLVQTEDVRPFEGVPRRIECNLRVPVLPAGTRTLYFFPDRLLVYEGRHVGAVAYGELTATAGTTRFIEEGRVPRDTTIVGQTWKFINKSGGPDRRFNNNYQIPIVEYGVLDLSSSSGLRSRFMCSRASVAASVAQVITRIARGPLHP